MFARLLIGAALAVATSACSGAIYRQKELRGNDSVVITVDARQRVLLSQAEGQRNASDPAFRRFCAEPSPDAFTVLGVAASGGGNLLLDSSAKSASGALQAAFSSGETGTTIARTQTVNMLREMMFRTCERYLSGAISSVQFQTIAARDQRIMVSILAIEQLTGSLTPPPVSITASGGANTGFDPTELAKLLDERAAAVTKAKADVSTKQGLYDAANTAAKASGKDCDTLAATATADLTGTQPDQLAKCKSTATDLATGKQQLETAQALYDGMMRRVQSGQGVSSATTTGGVDFGSGTARAEAVTQVADNVERIVALTFQQDETQLFCLQTLDEFKRDASLGPIAEACMQFLETKVKADQAVLAKLYGVSAQDFSAAFQSGATELKARQRAAPLITQCVKAKPNDVKAALSTTGVDTDKFMAAAQAGKTAIELDRIGDVKQGKVIAALNTLCRLGA